MSSAMRSCARAVSSKRTNPRYFSSTTPQHACHVPHVLNNVELSAMATHVRGHVIRMAGLGGCFIGSALSCTDILVHLYARVMRGACTSDPDRDRFILSKGHAVPALYGVLVELGHLQASRLEAHLSADEDDIYWHPNAALPGVEIHTGSLGHGLALAAGIALDLKLRGSPGNVYCMVGDGELNEGSVWEAILVASARKLDNLCVIVDRNGFQANSSTEQLVPLEPLADKFRAFGCNVKLGDGHDFADLDDALVLAPENDRPTVLIAKTIRGRGISRIENDWDKWFIELDDAGVAEALRDLHARAVGAA